MTPYSQEYLSLLARKGKLFAKKIGRNWFTTETAVKDYLTKQSVIASLPQIAKIDEFTAGQKSILEKIDHISSSLEKFSRTDDGQTKEQIKKPRGKKVLFSVLLIFYFSALFSLGAMYSDGLKLSDFKSEGISALSAQTGDILEPVRDFVRKYLLPEYGYETYLVVDPYQSYLSKVKEQESRILELEKKLSVALSKPSPTATSEIKIIKEVVIGPSGVVLTQIEQRIDNAISLIEATKINLSNLSNDFTSFQRMTPTTFQLPPTNTSGIGPITLNPDKLEVGTITATGGSTFNSTLSVLSDFTVDTNVLKVDTTNNRVGINTSTPEVAFEVVGAASVSGAFTVGGTLTVAGNIAIGTTVAPNQLTVIGSGSFTGQLKATRAPVVAHTGTWPSFTGTANATLYINPSSSIADGNVIAYVSGSDPKFVVDAEGDIYGKSLILTGTTTTGTTSVTGDLTVEGNTQLGDASGDKIKFVGTILPYSLSTIPLSVKASASQTVDIFRVRDSSDNVLLTLDQGTGLLTASSGFNFALGGSTATVSYSRLGTATTTHSNYISRFNDLLISGDLETRGTSSFGGVASVSGNFFTYGTNTFSGTGSNSFAGSLSVAKGFLAGANNALVVNGSATANTLNIVGGNVGIGTTSPSVLLEAAGKVRLGTSSFGVSIAGAQRDTHYLDIQQTQGVRIGTGAITATYPIAISVPGGDVGVSIRNTGINGDQWLLASTDDSSSAVFGGAGRFSIWQGSTGSIALTINSSRNVGIGTTSPDSLLELSSTASNFIIRSTGSTSSASIDFQPAGGASSSNQGKFTIRAGGLGGSAERLDIINADNTKLFTIASSGNVGIGTTVPNTKLTILESGSLSTNSGGALQIEGSFNIAEATQTGGPIVAFNNQNMDKAVMQQWFSSGALANSQLNLYGTGSDAAFQARIYNTGAVSDLLLNPIGGNVGIGTTGPIGALDLSSTADRQIFIGASSDPGWAVPAIQIGVNGQTSGGGAIYKDAVGYITIGNNAYSDGANEIAVQTGSANALTFQNGPIIFRAATGLTAGNNITWTETMRITSAGNVGIGTTNPTAKLHVSQGTFKVTDATQEWSLYVDTGNIRLDNGGVALMSIRSSADKRTAFQGIYDNTNAGAVNVVVQTDGTVYRSTSSKRYKQDIQYLTLEDVRDIVMALKPVTYRGINQADSDRLWPGFIAEDVAAIAPILATYDDGIMGGLPNYVMYDRVPAYLVPVVQDHESRIASLSFRIEELEKKMAPSTGSTSSPQAGSGQANSSGAGIMGGTVISIASGSPSITTTSASGLTMPDVLAELANAAVVRVQSIWAKGDIIAEGIKKTYYAVSNIKYQVLSIENWGSREITIAPDVPTEVAALFAGNAAQAAEQSKVDLAENGLYLATYGVDSTRGEIQLSGSSEITGGEAKVFFDFSFTSVISDKIPLKVIITPTTLVQGQLYVSHKTQYGFVVKSQNGPGDAKFDWLAIARRKGYEGADQIDLISNYSNSPNEPPITETASSTEETTPNQSSDEDATGQAASGSEETLTEEPLTSPEPTATASSSAPVD